MKQIVSYDHTYYLYVFDVLNYVHLIFLSLSRCSAEEIESYAYFSSRIPFERNGIYARLVVVDKFLILYR